MSEINVETQVEEAIPQVEEAMPIADVMSENDRTRECANIIIAALESHKCELKCSAIINDDGKINFDIKVLAKKE